MAVSDNVDKIVLEEGWWLKDPYANRLPNKCYKHYLLKMKSLIGPQGWKDPRKEIHEDVAVEQQETEATTSMVSEDPVVVIEEKNVAENAPSPSVPKTPKKLSKKEKKAVAKAAREKAREAAKLSKKRRRSEANEDESESPAAIQRPKISKEQQIWIPYQQSYGARRSALTVEEHSKFVAMLCSQKSSGKLRFKDNAPEFKNFKQRLQPEHGKFNEFVRSQTSKTLIATYNHLPATSNNYVTQCLKAKADAMVNFPKRFRTFGNISADLLGQKDIAVLELSKVLLEVGKLARIKLPDMTRKATVCIEATDRVSAKFPPSEKVEKKFITEDQNVPMLVEKYAPDFVTSFSAVRTLVCLHGMAHGQEWDVPVYVKDIFVQGRRQKVVYICKPLPPRSMENRQKLLYMAKYALKSQLLDVKSDATKSQAQDFDKNAVNLNNEDDIFGNYNPEEVETFMGEQTSNSPKRLRLDIEKSADESESTEKGGFEQNKESRSDLTEIGEGTQSTPKQRSTSVQQTQNDRKETDVLGDIIEGMKTVQSKKRALPGTSVNAEKELPVEDARDFVASPKYGNFRQYSLWRIRDHQILIRSNIDGLCKTIGKDKCEKHVRTSVSAKVEYLASHGGQKLRPVEVLFDWWTAFLKRSEIHVRGRIKGKPTYDILAAECLTKDNELKLNLTDSSIQRAVADGMRRLQLVLTELKKLDDGVYILRGNSNDVNISIMKAADDTDDKYDFDMKEAYENNNWTSGQQKQRKVSDYWTGIDPDVIFQWHRVWKRIPATFQPRIGDEQPQLDASAKKSKRHETKRSGGKMRKLPVSRRDLNTNISDQNLSAEADDE